MSSGTSSEDVLLMVNHVHHKKNDGTLYMMNERIAWMPDGKDTFLISHKYADIKMQKISPEGKPKVQLQLVLHNGDTTTFHFANPMGNESQLQDRNGVKELLQQLLPKFKRKINKELEEKNKILSEDPVLFQLYRDLVVSRVITADEFWANHVKKPIKNNLNPVQEVGVSGSFLIGISPQTDGSCGIKYNITPEIIDSIFRTYPAVKRKHMENVPHKISESEFWTKFFQSHYFHRDRLNINSKDLFSECAKIDEQEVKQAIDKGIPDPFVDLTSFDEDPPVEDVKVPSSSQNTQKEINQSMIRRFNHHSMMVLQSCARKRTEAFPNSETNAKKPALQNNCVLPTNLKINSTITSSGKNTIKDIVKDKIEYEDLNSETRKNASNLNLTKVSRYLSGPIPIIDPNYPSPEDIINAMNIFNHSVLYWKPELPTVLAPSSAIVALGELMPGGSLMKNVDSTQLKDTIPIEIQVEMKQLYCALSELLRHFWCCFPTTSPQLEEKVIAMRDSLERFEYAKLNPFQEKLQRNCLPLQLVEHMRGMLQFAYKKHSTWQSRLGR